MNHVEAESQTFKVHPIQFLKSYGGARNLALHLALALIIVNIVVGAASAVLFGFDVLDAYTALFFLALTNTAVFLVCMSRIFAKLEATEAARQSTLRLLTDIVKSSPAWICVKNLKGRAILTNDIYDACTATSAESYLDSDAQKLDLEDCQSDGRTPHSSEGLEGQEIEVLRTGRSNTSEEEKIVGSEPVQLLVTRYPLYNSKQRVIGVASFGLDVTELKETQEHVRQSEEAFRALADSVPAIVWSTTEDGNIRYFNRRWTEYTGLAIEKSLGNSWWQAIHPEDIQKTKEVWRKCVALGTSFSVEHRVRRSDGSYRWHLVRGEPAHDGTGRVIKWFGSSTDIDDQKRAAEVLEEKVRERTAELTVSNAELEAFNYTISHDLRAPLRVIEGLGELILERHSEKLDKGSRGYAEEIVTASRSMESLIEALLTFARVGRVELVRERVDLSALALEILNEKVRLDPGRKIDIRVRPGLEVVADKIRIFRVMASDWRLYDVFERHGGSVWAQAEVGKGASFSFCIDSKVAEKLH